MNVTSFAMTTTTMSTPSMTSSSTAAAAIGCDEPEHLTRLYDHLEFWLTGVLVMLIGSIGLIGNSIAIPLLFSKHLDSIFNRILVCLAITDNVFITTCLLEALRYNE